MRIKKGGRRNCWGLTTRKQPGGDERGWSRAGSPGCEEQELEGEGETERAGGAGAGLHQLEGCGRGSRTGEGGCRSSGLGGQGVEGGVVTWGSRTPSPSPDLICPRPREPR